MHFNPLPLYHSEESLVDNIRAFELKAHWGGGLSWDGSLAQSYRGRGRGVGWAQHLAAHAHDILLPCGITGGRPRLRRSPPAFQSLFCLPPPLPPSLHWLVNRDYTQNAWQSDKMAQHVTEWMTHWGTGDKKEKHFLVLSSLFLFPLLL